MTLNKKNDKEKSIFTIFTWDLRGIVCIAIFPNLLKIFLDKDQKIDPQNQSDFVLCQDEKSEFSHLVDHFLNGLRGF